MEESWDWNPGWSDAKALACSNSPGPGWKEGVGAWRREREPESRLLTTFPVLYCAGAVGGNLGKKDSLNLGIFQHCHWAIPRIKSRLSFCVPDVEKEA